MSSLSDVFRQAVSDDKDLRMSAEAQPDIGYPTGILNFDFMNGYVSHVDNSEKNIHEEYYSLGISNGSMVMVIGRSGCGKSTFCTQIAANIVRPFPNATIFEDSLEGGMNAERREQLSGFSGDEYKKRFIIRNTGITAENFLKRIKAIHDLKLANRDQFTYDTGKLDKYGEPIKMLEPTVYILDSIALIMPEEMVEEGEVSSNMKVVAVTKTVTDIVRRILPMLKMANIILVIVNHIMQNISVTPTKADLAFLKQNESLPRGKTIVYLCNTVIRLDDKKMKADEKLHVAGSLVSIENTKSRSAAAGRKTTLVFTYEYGFDPELSLFLMLQDAGRVHGAGIGYYLDDYKDYKFSLRQFKDKLKENPEFYKIFTRVALDELKKYLVEQNTTIDQRMAVTSDILKML